MKNIFDEIRDEIPPYIYEDTEQEVSYYDHEKGTVGVEHCDKYGRVVWYGERPMPEDK